MADRGNDYLRYSVAAVVFVAWAASVAATIVVPGYEVRPSVTVLATAIVTGLFAERVLSR